MHSQFSTEKHRYCVSKRLDGCARACGIPANRVCPWGVVAHGRRHTRIVSRRRHGLHGLLEVLFIALATVLSGGKTAVDRALFSRGRRKHSFASFLSLKHGLPSHDTLSRVFRLRDPQQFCVCFQRFTALCSGLPRGHYDRRQCGAALVRQSQPESAHVLRLEV